MRVLLDECLDRRFAAALRGHEVRTVRQQDWTGLANGQLLMRAVGAFDVFITVDANISFQQNLSDYDIAVIVLKARSNRAEDLNPLGPAVLEAIPIAPKGALTRIPGPEEM